MNTLQIAFCDDYSIDITINNMAGVNFISVYILLMCGGLLAFEFLATPVTWGMVLVQSHFVTDCYN